MESSVCSQDVCLIFLIPTGLTEESCAPSLISTYQACIENDLNPQWRTAEECLNMKPNKLDVFVCEPFDGDVFNYLKSDNFKCVVLGPRCLLSCLHRSISIPELPSPIHNISMHKLVITLTGFEKVEKEELRKIITMSSGVYSNNFSESVTHLVANTVGSKKYIVAVEREIPIMTGEWLRSVWKAVCKDFRLDTSATDEQFLSYKCHMFQNLVICVSQMPRKAKEAIKKKIEEHGGTYSPSLDMSITSVLIIPTPAGDKFKHAQNWRIQCLTPDWIYDSVEIGHALNMDGYEVKGRGASTPTRENSLNVPPDYSICSTILNDSEIGHGRTHVNDTLQQTMLSETFLCKRGSLSDEHVIAIDDLDLQIAMKAGHFLDGCKIFLSGFNEKHMEKLRRILNTGGATRFSQLTESVSHVIIGKIVEEHMSIIMSWTSKPHVVYADWIAESIKLKKPADEAQFSYTPEGPSTPKRPRINARRSSPRDDDETLVDEALINKYLMPRLSVDGRKSMPGEETMNESALPDSQDSTALGIFYGKIFTISGFTQKITEDYITLIREHSGEVVSFDYKGRVDYSVTNIEGTGLTHAKAIEVVSIFFLQDCFDLDKWEEPKLVEVQYYHLPLQFIKNVSHLSDCTFAVSTYAGLERQLIIALATCLGARFQESFAKKNNPGKNIKASTHLICPTTVGEKYKAAQKWKVHAVTHDWLLACFKSGKWEPEELYSLENPDRRVLDGKKIIRDLFNSHLDTSNAETTIVGETLFTPVNVKLQSLRKLEAEPSPSAIKTPDIETIRKMYPTPGVSRGDESLDEMKTPDTPYGCTWNPNPSACVRKAYKRLLDSLPDENPAQIPARHVDPGTPIEEYYKRFHDQIQDELKNYKMHTPVWKKKKEVKSSKTNNLEDDKVKKNLNIEDVDMIGVEGETNEGEENEGPLSGVVICTASKHQDQQRSLYDAVSKLGGDYRWSLDQSVTHFVFRGQHNDRTKEFRMAREEGKMIVAPEWVWMCQDEQKKINEELFPHTHNPKTTLSLSILTSKVSNTSYRGRPKKKVDVDDKNDPKTQDETEDDDDTALNESLSRQLKEILALASVSGSEHRSLTRSKSISEKLKVTPKRTLQYETQPATLDVPESQSTAITWVDPQEREARQKLQDHITRDTQDIINDNLQVKEAEEREEEKENLPTLSEEPSQEESSMLEGDERRKSTSSELQYKFVISGMTDVERERYIAIIIGLGGSMSTTQHFDSSCSHVVTVKPSRSEKHLAAIASGKWLLHTSFLEESGKAGRFLEEAPYEWGNISSKCIPTMDEGSMEKKLAICSRRWRTTLDRNRKRRGAFHGMKALIHCDKTRFEAFSRLIAAGGGEVISARPPYIDVQDVSHVFVELHRNPAKIDLAHFASLKIPCLAPLFLNEYLVNDPPQSESKYLIEEYKQILNDTK